MTFTYFKPFNLIPASQYPLTFYQTHLPPYANNGVELAYLPPGANPDLVATLPHWTTYPPATVTPTIIKSHLLQANINATGNPTTVIAKRWYYPGWQLTVDHQTAPIYPDPTTKLITFSLSPGLHQVTLTYVGTTLQHVANLVSALGLVIFFILWFTKTTPEVPS